MGKDTVGFIGEVSKRHEFGEAWVIEWPRTLVHYHTYGKLTPYFKALGQGKLMATRCTNPGCPISAGDGEAWLPPRADCPDCHMPMEWVELSQPVVGTVYSYTHVKRGGAGLEIETPYYQIDVRIDGCCTIPKGYLIDAGKEPAIGMKVTPVFRTKDPTNTSLDIAWKTL